MPNFALLDLSQPDVARLVAAMVQAHDAVHLILGPSLRFKSRRGEIPK
jgi:hypothetical protein